MSLVPDGIRAAFFDAVGTLIFPDPPAHEAYAAIAAGQGATLDATAVRTRFHDAFQIEENSDRENGWRTSEERERARWRTIVMRALAELPRPEAGFEALWEHFARPESWRVNPDAGEVLASLAARGVILGMGTNYDARVNRVLAGLPELAPVAERLVVSAAVGWRKPAEEFFVEVIRAAGCPADAILFVGDDRENDFEGARAAGLFARHLDPSGANDGAIRSLRELL